MRLRLPLLICALLLVSLTAYGVLAYWHVERALVETAGTRLQGMSAQLASLLVQSAQQRVDEVRRVGAHAPLRALFDAPTDDARRAAAKADLEAFLAGSPQTLGAELWSRSGERIVALVQPKPPSNRPVPPIRTQAPKAAGFTPVQAFESLAYYEVVGDVTAAQSGTPAGFVVLRRGLSQAGTADAITKLIGGGVIVRLGSRGDGAWTDFSTVIPAPPVPERDATVIDFQETDGTGRIAAVARVQNTPWLVWIAMSRYDALATARALVSRMVPFAFGIAVLGAVLMWFAARRVTQPLDELTRAAEAIAAGDLSQRAGGVRHGDEVGRLGEAFNIMSDRVMDGMKQLDERVRERTAELETALTTLQETRDELVRREKLATLGHLASGVGHELRNPLGVMTNAVYFLDMVQPDASEDVKEYHGLLRAQIGLCEKIVSDLLDFARVKPPRREQVSLNHLLTEQFSRLSLTDGVRVAREVPADLPAAHIDPVQIGQVVFNLLVNAVQAMEGKEGVLTVRATPVHNGNGNGHRPDLLRLDVTDTGPGVPPELREKIFEALYTTKARGIGLGLSVSRSLAESNGGELTVASPPGQGATFTLTMPTVSAEAA